MGSTDANVAVGMGIPAIAVGGARFTEGFSGDPEMLQRFYREAAKTGALHHPNIVIVHDLGEQDGFPYIVMEYLSGDPLDKLIQSNRPQTLAYKLKIIEQVCYALGYAHRNDMIHRTNSYRNRSSGPACRQSQVTPPQALSS